MNNLNKADIDKKSSKKEADRQAFEKNYHIFEESLNTSFVSERISELRIQKNISEYKLSIELGHCKSYIQNISSGRAMPSMREFFYICDYFQVSPKEFFDVEENNSSQVHQLIQYAKLLNPECLSALISVAEQFYSLSRKP